MVLTIKNTLSVVIPTYNEEGNIELLYNKLRETIDKLELEEIELIFVDDGSHDDSLEIIRRIAELDAQVKYISFSRNFGHQLALKAGLDHARFQGVISLDADLQHPVELIPRMIEKWRAGVDVVYSKRIDKTLPWFKRTSSKLFYRIVNSLSQIKLEDGVADFRLLDQKVVHALLKHKETNLFIRGIIPLLDFAKKPLNTCQIKDMREKQNIHFLKCFDLH